MKRQLLMVLLSVAAIHASDLKSLSVLYIGDTGTPRAANFSNFIRTNVNKFESTARKGFNPAKAENFDVVVLDWPQGGDDGFRQNPTGPIGPREKWQKPMVLVGSAGLNLAVVWKVRGGSG